MAIQYLDMEGLQLYNQKIKEVISTKSENIIQKQNYLLFPSIGNSNLLYIDIDNNSAYRWDDTKMKYFCISSNYSNIEMISGGTSVSN